MTTTREKAPTRAPAATQGVNYDPNAAPAQPAPAQASPTSPANAPAASAPAASTPAGPPKRPGPKPATAAPPATKPTQQSLAKVSFAKVGQGSGHRVALFGPGGVGKTTLACTAPGTVAMFDLDESLPRLRGKFAAWQVDEPVVIPNINTFADVANALNADGWDGIKTIAIDSTSKLEELAIAHVLATVKMQDGSTAANIEAYGYGKGYQHVYDVFNTLFPILDRHTRAGRNVILVCHECTSDVPNPRGPEWKRYEPRLQTSSSGKASIRLRLKEWVDHMLFIGYDIDVAKDGVAKGSGTATVYPRELPFAMAKSRTMTDPVSLEEAVWGLWPKLLV